MSDKINMKIPIINRLFSVVIAGIFLASCASKSEEKTQDSVLPAMDSIVEDTVALAEDSIRIYYSPDLKSFGIRGDVIERSKLRHDAQAVYPIPTMELTFDSIGNFTGSLEGLYAKQNEDGINYMYSMNYEDGTSWELTYTEFNDKSYPLKAEIIESGPQGTAKADIAYFGYEYDREGNWVMRSASMERTFTDTDTKEKTSTFHKWKELVSYQYKEGEKDDQLK